jgi:branched-chain amino acid transport system ATP-binding protein
MAAVLEAFRVSKRFGGITAVDGVSFEVQRGGDSRHDRPQRLRQIHLVQLHVSASCTPSAGEVKARRARRRPALRPCDLNRLGVSRTFQLLQVFPKTVGARESDPRRAGASRARCCRGCSVPRDAGLSAAADQMIGFFKLGPLADEPAGGLSYGQQKLLDAAMAFMGGPRLVLLDEPAGGVNLTMLADPEGPAEAAINREKRRDLRGDRAQYGFRDVAVLAGAW